VPYQVFEVRPAMNAVSDARDHLILAVGNDGQFAKFCDVARHPELATDVRFSKNTERVKNRKVLVPLLEKIMMTRTKAQWLPALEMAKVPCGAINNLSEVFADPQVLARNMINTWQHPHQKDLQLVGSPLKLSLTPVREDHAPPQLGQHSAQILNEVLGYSETQIEQLQSKGVI
jgi:crotonobetainyl-CoA:carnitine CoA-transferase CaiB-like acyl-CoA transferase